MLGSFKRLATLTNMVPADQRLAFIADCLLDSLLVECIGGRVRRRIVPLEVAVPDFVLQQSLSPDAPVFSPDAPAFVPRSEVSDGQTFSQAAVNAPEFTPSSGAPQAPVPAPAVSPSSASSIKSIPAPRIAAGADWTTVGKKAPRNKSATATKV